MAIRNGWAFWGDYLDAPVELVCRAHRDDLILEYRAELTMSILAVQRQRAPQSGFATDCLTALERLAPHLLARPRLKIVTNAGGMDPATCAARTWATLAGAGRISAVLRDHLQHSA
jgi:hypothetical protein